MRALVSSTLGMDGPGHPQLQTHQGGEEETSLAVLHGHSRESRPGAG